MNYGKVEGTFLAPNGERTPLTGRIVFEPTNQILGDPGIDYAPAPITGFLDLSGALRSADGSPIMLAYGEWVAHFRLRYEHKSVPIKSLAFTLDSDIWITQVPGSGWEFEVVPHGDGTADLLGQNIIFHNDGTATIRMA